MSLDETLVIVPAAIPFGQGKEIVLMEKPVSISYVVKPFTPADYTYYQVIEKILDYISERFDGTCNQPERVSGELSCFLECKLPDNKFFTRASCIKTSKEETMVRKKLYPDFTLANRGAGYKIEIFLFRETKTILVDAQCDYRDYLRKNGLKYSECSCVIC